MRYTLLHQLSFPQAATGTDPQQGAALARAMLESFLEMGARVVTTTSEARKCWASVVGYMYVYTRTLYIHNIIYIYTYIYTIFFVLISTIRHSNQLKDWAFQAGNARSVVNS